MQNVTPAKTLAAVKLVTKGKAYRLGIETNKDTPAYPPRWFKLTILQPGQAGGATLGPTRTTYNDDIVTGWNGIGSQIDGFGHIGIDNLYFNCNRAGDFAMADGLTKLGIENVPAVATRGIVLDMAGYFGTDIVKEGTPFNRAEIEGARYLASLGVAMVGADNPSVEVIPFEKDSGAFEVHQILLALNGIHILENMNTAELVEDQAWESCSRWGRHASRAPCRRSSIPLASGSARGHRPVLRGLEVSRWAPRRQPLSEAAASGSTWGLPFGERFRKSRPVAMTAIR